jgi:2-(1,2-epoxy-1,2-dihydrophenyl)acetyl-CoA isomerase
MVSPECKVDTGTDELLCTICERVATITFPFRPATLALRTMIKQCGDDAEDGAIISSRGPETPFALAAT